MNRFRTPAWIMRHVIAVTLVGSFLALGWWQTTRAAAGNVLSWAYAVEWPIFAGFVVFLWLREVRHELHGGRLAEATPESETDSDPGGTSGSSARSLRGAASGPEPQTGIRRPIRSTRVPVLDEADAADEAGGELAAYNHYLSWLNANPGARSSDYPG